MNKYPFLFGAQYYRAPTPEPACWEYDLRRMRDLGFNAVKLWVQWRWSHRGEGRFHFADVDALMDMAHANGLAVTINTIFDVSPLWLFEKYPDARQINASGQVIEPYTVGHRQVGGHPGPCYSHPGALAERERFLEAAVEHYRGHPALSMWDLWNEPEQSFGARTPDLRTLTCYCPYCRAGFHEWLRRKYGDLTRLNAVWGRCYEEWRQVELPYNGGTVTDFVDWREFHLDVMAAEAGWRLDLAKERDPAHPAYLHVVPNTMRCFSSVTCVDDFAMAEKCDVWAATMNGGPVFPSQVVSAARGKVCYNVESHVNFGSTGMHQRRLGLPELLADFLPQIGFGIRGFLFWQYRAEVLGVESPAWGVVGLDGEDRPVTRAVREFWQTLSPHTEALLSAAPSAPAVGIWKSRKNEIFHFAVHGSLNSLADSVEGYIHALYWNNLPFRMVSERMLSEGDLAGVKVLVTPSCYYLTEEEAAGLDRWVHAGGVLLSEAHLAGYNGSIGRHSRVLPGCGLAQSWGLRETDSTSSHHLRLDEAGAFEGDLPDDVRKALRDAGTAGGRHFPIRLRDGIYAWGASRYAVLEGEGLTPEGTFNGETCIASLPVGAGWVLYAGTNLGEGRGEGGLLSLLRACCRRAGVSPTLDAAPEIAGTVHLDLQSDAAGPRFLVVNSRADCGQALNLEGAGAWRGLFTGQRWELAGASTVEVPAGLVDLFVKEG